MNFFKSVFADDDEPDSPNSASHPNDHHIDSASDSEPESDPKSPPQSNPDSESASVVSSVWDFGGLIKTITTKSESMIDTYKRDLQEFSTGLKAETAVLREVANRAVKELPKAGVSTFDELKSSVLKGTEQIISQGKEALLLIDQEIGSPVVRSGGGDGRSLGYKESYNRFDVRLRGIQIDKETYLLDPEDSDDYKKWRSEFDLEEKGEELGNLFEENAAMENIYHKIVPSEIDPETFWFRYFYKVHKMKLAEEVRASFLKKAIDDDEEELSWDVDEEEKEEDSDAGEGGGSTTKVGESVVIVSENERKLDNSESSGVVEVNKVLGSDADHYKGISKVDENVVKEELQRVASGKSEEKVHETKIEDKVDKTSDVNETEKAKVEDTVVSQENKSASHLEKEVKDKSEDSASKTEPGTTTDEDLEWDEIEDEGSDGEKPVAPRKSQDKAELQKRLSSAVEDEDLSWDIEDDDEPVKP